MAYLCLRARYARKSSSRWFVAKPPLPVLAEYRVRKVPIRRGGGHGVPVAMHEADQLLACGCSSRPRVARC